jgi:hypothetical protein
MRKLSKRKTATMPTARMRTALLLTSSVQQWFPTLGRDPNQGRGASDVGSREGVMEKVFLQILCEVSICPIHHKFIPF